MMTLHLFLNLLKLRFNSKALNSFKMKHKNNAIILLIALYISEYNS